MAGVSPARLAVAARVSRAGFGELQPTRLPLRAIGDRGPGSPTPATAQKEKIRWEAGSPFDVAQGRTFPYSPPGSFRANSPARIARRNVAGGRDSRARDLKIVFGEGAENPKPDSHKHLRERVALLFSVRAESVRRACESFLRMAVARVCGASRVS